MASKIQALWLTCISSQKDCLLNEHPGPRTRYVGRRGARFLDLEDLPPERALVPTTKSITNLPFKIACELGAPTPELNGLYERSIARHHMGPSLCTSHAHRRQSAHAVGVCRSLQCELRSKVIRVLGILRTQPNSPVRASRSSKSCRSCIPHVSLQRTSFWG